MGGQACILGTRILVQDTVYDEFLTRATKLTSTIVLGDPYGQTTAMGPVVNAKACERILNVISDAVDNGHGQLVVGGQRAGGELADGYFITPTVFGDVDPSASIAREEIFGPVVAPRAMHPGPRHSEQVTGATIADSAEPKQLI